MNKFEISSGKTPWESRFRLNDEEFEGVRSLDVRMRIAELPTITAEIYSTDTNLIFENAKIFILIGDKKYELVEVPCRHEKAIN